MAMPGGGSPWFYLMTPQRLQVCCCRRGLDLFPPRDWPDLPPGAGAARGTVRHAHRCQGLRFRFRSRDTRTRAGPGGGGRVAGTGWRWRGRGSGGAPGGGTGGVVAATGTEEAAGTGC